MTLPNIYRQGTQIRCSVVFTDPLNGNVDLDPSFVHFSFRTPSGVVTEYVYGTDPELLKDSVGHYHVDLSLTEPKTWYYSFWSPGPVGECAEETTVIVEPNRTL